jgi:uncharacterized membrane protein YgcG
MKCPRCVQVVEPRQVQCGGCGFSIGELDEEFGNEAVVLERLADDAHCLRMREREQLEQALDGFEEAFPQLFAAIYIGVFPPMTNIRQFGFWLLNRAAVNCVDVTRPNERGILFVLDLNSKQLGVTLGYQLEPFLTEKDVSKCFRAVKPHFSEGDHALGLRKALVKLSQRLKKRSGQARRRPERFYKGRLRAPSMPNLMRVKTGVDDESHFNSERVGEAVFDEVEAGGGWEQ